MSRADQLLREPMRHPPRATVALLVVLLATTIVATLYAARAADRDRRQHVEREAATTTEAIDRRMSAYGDALVALRGLFEIDADPSRERFSRFARSLQLDTRTPGFRVVAYARAVNGADLEAHGARLRRAGERPSDGYPPFNIHPAGRRLRYLPIEYMEPVEGNEPALGFDLLSDPVRAAAANRTQASGQPAATAPVRLVQQRGPGRTAFVLMLAVRNRGGSLTSPRTGRLQGVVSAAFDVSFLVNAILGDRAREFDLEIYDAGATDAPRRGRRSQADILFDGDGVPVLARGRGPGEGVVSELHVGGRRWLVYYAPGAGAEGLPGRSLPWIVAGSGLLISFLASWLFLTLAHGRSRAQGLAERMTRDLALSERHNRQIVETAHDAFVAIDESGRITDWNRQAEATFGWSRDEVLGRDVAETIVPPHLREAHRAGFDRFLATGVGHTTGRVMEVTAMHRGGREIPVELTIAPVRVGDGYAFNAFVRDISERRAAAELNERQRRRLMEAQSIAGLGSWEWDITTDGLEWSDELCRIFGVEPGDHPAGFDGYIELVHPDDRERARARVQEAYATGKPFAFNHRVLLRDGSERVVDSRGEVIVDSDGKPVRMLGTAQDVTERERIEAELRRGSRYFELARDLVCTVGQDGYFKQINPAWTRTLGWTEEELLSRPYMDFVHPDDRAATDDDTVHVLEAGKAAELVNRYRTKTGDWRWLEWTSMTEPDDGLIYAAARDITERRRSEEQVRRNQTLLADLLDSAPDAVIIADERGKIVLVNEQTERMFGYQRQELHGQPIEVLMPGRVRERHVGHREGYVAAPVSRRMGVGLDLAGRRKDGSEFPVDISLSAVDSDNGRLATAFVRDVTERRQTENELAVAHERALEASRLKSEFVANMSHEIRTPLNGIIGMAGLLLETELSEEQREYVEAVSLSGDALMSVISDILDFSKIEAGKLELDRHVFDLRELVDGVAAILGTAAYAKDLELMTWVDPDLPEAVYGDSARIRQVLTNLATNAVKFTSEGEVVIRVTLEPGTAATLRFEVRDTGIGIPPAALESIFDAFSQADSSTTRQFGGTGLGLAISSQLVDLMDGTIGVESEPGGGSTFWFTVPLMVRRDRVSASSRHDFSGVRALVVDDSPTSRAILEHQLVSWGIACDAADGASQAMDLIEATATTGEPYELALIDFHMPGVNGLELARQVRAIPGLGDMRVLMLTSSGAERTLVEEPEVDGLIAKPVRQARLGEEIAELLGGDGRSRPAPTRPAVEPARHEEPEGPVDPAEGPHVLVVEDNPVNQLVATRMLERLGCRVDLAANGQEAVDMVARNDYAVVFMDCQMPVLDGYEATAFIRRSESDGRRIPIVAMTANTLKGDRERCLAAGMDDYLGKPLGPEELDIALDRALGRRKVVSALPYEGAESEFEPAADLVDPSRLDDAFGSDHEARAGLVAHFLSNSRTTISDLGHAIQDGDAAAAARLAHGLKGSSAVVGAERLSKIAARLCDILTGGEIAEESTTLQRELERTFELTDKAFNRETNEAIP